MFFVVRNVGYFFLFLYVNNVEFDIFIYIEFVESFGFFWGGFFEVRMWLVNGCGYFKFLYVFLFNCFLDSGYYWIYRIFVLLYFFSFFKYVFYLIGNITSFFYCFDLRYAIIV